MGDGFFGISSTSWKSFLFGGETNGIIGCGNVSVQKNIVEADAASDSHSGDLSKIYPDVKPDITDISSWLDILEIDSFDSKPDVIVIPPEIIVETTQNTGDIPVDQDTNDTSDQYNFDETEAMCLSTNEIPYDHSAQNCTIDLADVDGDGFCKKDYEIENSALQCPKETGNIGTDCNDDAQNINPNAQEIACNNIDENCDAIIYLDNVKLGVLNE